MSAYKINQGEVDNGIFEIIRLEVVARGYLPNFTAYQNKNDYNNAKKAIITGGKEVIEIFGVGGFDSRGEKNENNIIIDRKTPRPATTGVGIAVDYDKQQDGSFKKEKQADTKYDIQYQITYFTQKSSYADIIESILLKCFGARKLVDSLDDTGAKTGEFWLIRKGDGDTSGDPFIERHILFDARNIDLVGGTDEGVAVPMTTFNFNGAITSGTTTPQTAQTADTTFEIEIEIKQ